MKRESRLLEFKSSVSDYKVIALLARRLEFIEKQGTGIRLIIDSMKDRHLAAQFIEGPGWFKTVLSLIPMGEHSQESAQETVLRLLEP